MQGSDAVDEEGDEDEQLAAAIALSMQSQQQEAAQPPTLVRRIIKDDNSCLFNSVGCVVYDRWRLLLNTCVTVCNDNKLPWIDASLRYALMDGHPKDAATLLRQIASSIVVRLGLAARVVFHPQQAYNKLEHIGQVSDPDAYGEAFLGGKTNQGYVLPHGHGGLFAQCERNYVSYYAAYITVIILFFAFPTQLCKLHHEARNLGRWDRIVHICQVSVHTEPLLSQDTL